MDPDNYVYNEEWTSDLETKLVDIHSLEMTLGFCEEEKRQPTDEENEFLETPVWDNTTSGWGTMYNLKQEIKSASTEAEIRTLVKVYEKLADNKIKEMENKINEYPKPAKEE